MFRLLSGGTGDVKGGSLPGPGSTLPDRLLNVDAQKQQRTYSTASSNFAAAVFSDDSEIITDRKAAIKRAKVHPTYSRGY